MIRLVVIGIFFFFSLLTLFKAPTYHLWLAAIIFSEFAAFIFAVVLLLLLAGFWVEKYQLPGTILGIVTLLFILSPLWRAHSLSKTIDKDLGKVFESQVDTGGLKFNALNLFKFYGGDVKIKTFNYKQGLNLDFYPARATGFKPCVLVVHGGSWKSGDNKQLPELNYYLSEAGYHVAAINYRLAPIYKSPSAVQDVEAALDYLTVNSRQLHIDTSRIVLLGRSAGAQIALLAAYKTNRAGIKGVVDFYGPADMVWGYSVPSNPLVMDSRKVMSDYLGGTYEEVPDNYFNSSPIEFVSKTSVPTLIIHGENDVLVAYQHSVKLQKKLNENGVKNYFLSLPWATHGFDFHVNGPGGQLSTYATLRFVESVTR